MDVSQARLSTPSRTTITPRDNDHVTGARIGITIELLRGLGFDQEQARIRAMLAYSAYLGHAQLAHSTPELTAQSDQACRAYLEHVLQALGQPMRG